MQALRAIFKNLDHFRSSFITIFVVGVLSAGSGFLIPVMLSEFTTGELSKERLLWVSCIVLALYAATLPLQWLIRRYGEALGSKYSIYLRMKYFRELDAQPIQQLTKHHSGYALALISTVAEGLGSLSVEILWGLTHVVTNLSLFMYFTARQSSFIAGMNAGLLIIFVALSTVLAQRIVPLMSRLNLFRASMMERYVDFAANAVTVKRLALFPFVQRELENRTAEVYSGIDDFQRFHANRWFILHALFGLAYLSTILFLLWQIAENLAAPSVLILFVASYASIRGNIERLSENLKAVIEMQASLQNLSEVLPPLLPEREEVLPENWQTIELQGVSFAHPLSNTKIEIPEFKIQRGEKVLIAGPSGEGKTTLLNIIAGFYNPDQGMRLVDKRPYTNALMPRCAFVAQEAELFSISLRENFLLGAADKESSIEPLLERLDLLSWAKRLERGLDSKVGERGMRLSAGQRQRINLLRGLLLDREVYLLDEPTSHLDRVTEQRVLELLRERLKDKTVIIVSHREALEPLCDRRYSFTNHVLTEVSV